MTYRDNQILVFKGDLWETASTIYRDSDFGDDETVLEVNLYLWRV
jgi:hypothetical protein